MSNRLIDIGLSGACREYNKRFAGYIMPTFAKREVEQIHYEPSDTMVICFSGGKVSLSCALRYKDIGKNIILFHVAGPFKNTDNVQKMADMLDVPLVVHETMDSQKSPFSGMMILNAALEYAVGHQYSPRIVYGYFGGASIYNNDECDWANCSEFLESYKETAQRYVDGFTILNPMPNYSVMWDEILKHRAYIPYIEDKDVTDRRIFENIKMDYRLEHPNKNTYFKNLHYLKNMYNRKHTENLASMNELWNEYFFYRIENSMYYKDLMEKSFSSI